MKSHEGKREQEGRSGLQPEAASSVRIPAEWEPHAYCWMAWAVHREWGRMMCDVKKDLARVIRTISRYETVRLLAPPGPHIKEAEREFGSDPQIEIIPAPVDDIWLRDIAPTFAIRGEGAMREVVAIDWHFASWGNLPDRRRRPGDRLASIGSSIFRTPLLDAGFVMEGGSFLTDGRGRMIVTRSCLLHPNRSPVSDFEDRQHKIERDLARFGISQVVWLEGDPCERGTNGHVDGYVLLGENSTALIEIPDPMDRDPPMWRAHDAMLLRRLLDVFGEGESKVRFVHPPRARYIKSKSEMFASAYLNAYVTNGAVVMACFGDPERDEFAKDEVERLFPNKEVVQIRIDNLAEGGGGIHCLTQPMPATDRNRQYVEGDSNP